MANAPRLGQEVATHHGKDIEIVRRAPGAAMHELRQVGGPGSPSSFRMVLSTFVVGRSREADISIDSIKLSRRHAQFAFANGQWTLLDLDSRNGVFLNGLKIHSATLVHGDTVQLGSVVFEFREVKE